MAMPTFGMAPIRAMPILPITPYGLGHTKRKLCVEDKNRYAIVYKESSGNAISGMVSG
jgi:hypothetical protein